jgi:hypothetical protein
MRCGGVSDKSSKHGRLCPNESVIQRNTGNSSKVFGPTDFAVPPSFQAGEATFVGTQRLEKWQSPLGLDPIRVQIEAERKAEALPERKRPEQQGETVVFKPAAFRGFRNGSKTVSKASFSY